MHKRIFLAGLALCVTFMAGCAADEGDPAAMVEQYWRAKVEGNRDALQGLLCSEMEDQLDREARTFETVTGVELKDMACERSGDTTVSCAGVIVAAYGSENTEFPLGSSRVVHEDDGWKWCGEA